MNAPSVNKRPSPDETAGAIGRWTLGIAMPRNGSFSAPEGGKPHDPTLRPEKYPCRRSQGACGPTGVILVECAQTP